MISKLTEGQIISKLTEGQIISKLTDYKQGLSVHCIKSFTHVKHQQVNSVVRMCFAANACSVVQRPVWYASCVTGILVRILPDMRFIMMIASILRRSENRIIGLRFDGGPAFRPGFWSGVSCPNLISLGQSPVMGVLHDDCLKYKTIY